MTEMLISGEYFYNYMGLPSGDARDMAVIDQAILQASSYCEEYCNRPFLSGGLVEIPTDSAGDEISTYAYYDSIDDVPLDLKLACCILVRYYRFVAENMGIASTGHTSKGKSYDFARPTEATLILKRYKYFPDQP